MVLFDDKLKKATWSPKGCAKWPVNTRQFSASTWLVESRTKPNKLPSSGYWQSTPTALAALKNRWGRWDSGNDFRYPSRYCLYMSNFWLFFVGACAFIHPGKELLYVVPWWRSIDLADSGSLFLFGGEEGIYGVWRSSGFCKFHFSAFLSWLKRELVMLGKEAQREMWLKPCVPWLQNRIVERNIGRRFSHYRFPYQRKDTTGRIDARVRNLVEVYISSSKRLR